MQTVAVACPLVTLRETTVQFPPKHIKITDGIGKSIQQITVPEVRLSDGHI